MGKECWVTATLSFPLPPTVTPIIARSPTAAYNKESPDNNTGVTRLEVGPDFMTDIFTVETTDHARLQLQLSYNWYFDVNKEDKAAAVFDADDKGHIGAAFRFRTANGLLGAMTDKPGA